MLFFKKNLSRRLNKSIVSVLALALLTFFSMSVKCVAADYDWITVYPEHIGIFTTVGVQQFVAFGYKNDGTRENITRKVDWVSSNENVIKIDKDGLATIPTGITSGQVKITCSYPKTGKVATGVNLLLLKKSRYSVTPSAGANGTISPSTVQRVVEGATTTFTVTPDTGYTTASVDGTCGGTLVGTTYTTSSITADCTVSATFVINTYTLTYTAGANGSITGTTPQTVDYGADGAAVTAAPDANYHFVDWSDGSVANPRTDTAVTSDVTVTANFAIDTYTLTYTAGANGSITGTTPQTVDYGADGAAVTAAPDANYHFVDWSDGSVANPRTDTNVTSDVTVSANFAIDTFAVTPSTTGNGVISPSTIQTADYNTTVSFTLTPVDTFSLIDVTGTCPAGTTTDNGDGTFGYTTGAVTADCSVIANFTSI